MTASPDVSALADLPGTDLAPEGALAASDLHAMREVKLQDLKSKTPTDLIAFAEEVEVENASTMRKQELMFAILKQLAAKEVEIIGAGTVEVLQDGFGFLRSSESNYLPGPDDIYISPTQIRRFGLRTGDTVEGPIRGPKDGERYFALLKVNTINFENPEKIKHKVHFDNLTPLFPTQRFKLELDEPTEEGFLAPDHRHRRADRQGPARADRGAAAHRQDRADAEHRAVDHHQPPRVLPHRAAHRRAPGGGDRHAALGEGRGHRLDLRRAGHPPRAGRRDGDREGQAPGRARPRRGDPARFDHPPRAAPTTPWCRPRARC